MSCTPYAIGIPGFLLYWRRLALNDLYQLTMVISTLASVAAAGLTCRGDGSEERRGQRISHAAACFAPKYQIVDKIDGSAKRAKGRRGRRDVGLVARSDIAGTPDNARLLGRLDLGRLRSAAVQLRGTHGHCAMGH